mmetsp:Transcript_9415/g.11902  ORF Transcript_9415/g.11902 Transcript_9415/m.11902 type:complete len:126 (-) Transcript_9415:79-456(-)
MFNLENITAIFAISGWIRREDLTTAKNAVYVVWVAKTILCTVTVVGCALINSYLMGTTAEAANSLRTALSATKICFPQDLPSMSCPVDIQFIGTAITSYRRWTFDVQFVKKQLLIVKKDKKYGEV